jgi:hypothetical protein
MLSKIIELRSYKQLDAHLDEGSFVAANRLMLISDLVLTRPRLASYA